MARTSKKTRDGLKAKRTKISQVRKYREAEELDQLWERMQDMYRGKHFDNAESYEEMIAVNVAFATVNVIAPSVSVNYPKVTVRARRPEDADRAIITEAVVNYWWKIHGFLPEFQLAVKDMLIYGIGWVKVGWKFSETEVDDPEGYAKRLDAKRAEVDLFAAENPDLAGDLPSDEELADEVVSTKLQILEDRPFVERCSIHDILVDPEATSLRDAAYVAQRIVKDYEEVKNNKAYNASTRNSLQESGRIPDQWSGYSDHKENKIPDDAKRVTVYEFYDLKKREMCVFADTGEGYLVDPQPFPYDAGLPFVDLRNYDVPEEFYPMGELEALEPLQEELNNVRSAMASDRKAFRRAWVYRERAFDQRGLEALSSDADNRLIPVNEDSTLGETVMPLPTQQPNPQLYQDSGIIESDIQGVTGVSEYMRGGSSEIRRTATEAAIIQDASNARAADKRSKIESYIGHISRKVIQLGQQYLSGTQIARVTGRNGRDVFGPFSRDDIEGEYDFIVEGGSTQPYNEAVRRQNAVDLMTAMQPLFGSGMINEHAILEQVLKHALDVNDVSRFLVDPNQAAGPPQGGPSMGAPPPGPNGTPPGVEQMLANAQPTAAAANMVEAGISPGVGGPPGAGLPPEAASEIPPEILAQLLAGGGQPQ